MISKDFYTVKANGVDVSTLVKDFTTAPIPLALLTNEFIHVGYYKPFRQMYIDFSVFNTVDVGITFEYFNGSSWQPLTVVDETLSFTKSGFIMFERPEDWAKTTVDSDEQFYVRISPSADFTPETQLNGINVLLSNDIDLVGIRSNIVSKHNNGNTWIEKHEAARKYIIQQLRNLGHRKVNVNELSPFYFYDDKKEITHYSNLTQFDLLEPFELREAAKFYALAYIYLDELSDENDDKWERAGLRHEKRADEAINVFMLQIDNDDDGVKDDIENEGDTGTNLTWA